MSVNVEQITKMVCVCVQPETEKQTEKIKRKQRSKMTSRKAFPYYVQSKDIGRDYVQVSLVLSYSQITQTFLF
jgi:hypothetical protein